MAIPSAFTADMQKQMAEAIKEPPRFTDLFVSRQQYGALSTYTFDSGQIANSMNPILSDVSALVIGFAKVVVLPQHLYRQPDKPLKSRGKRKSVRARRQLVRRGLVAKYGPFPRRRVVRNGRRIRSMNGLSPNMAYLVDSRVLSFERMAMQSLYGISSDV